MDEDSPDVDESEEENIRKFLEREDEGEDVVWNRLRKSIKRMECMRCIRRRHNPLVMWFMQRLVNQRMMQASMDQVNPEIGKEQEYGELSVVVPCSGALLSGIVEFGVSARFGEEEGDGEDGHYGEG